MAEYRYYLIPDAMTRAFPEQFESKRQRNSLIISQIWKSVITNCVNCLITTNALGMNGQDSLMHDWW